MRQRQRGVWRRAVFALLLGVWLALLPQAAWASVRLLRHAGNRLYDRRTGIAPGRIVGQPVVSDDLNVLRDTHTVLGKKGDYPAGKAVSIAENAVKVQLPAVNML